MICEKSVQVLLCRPWFLVLVGRLIHLRESNSQKRVLLKKECASFCVALLFYMIILFYFRFLLFQIHPSSRVLHRCYIHRYHLRKGFLLLICLDGECCLLGLLFFVRGGVVELCATDRYFPYV